MKILDYDATTLGRHIRCGEITVTKGVETYIKHLQAVNPHLNALVQERFTQAMDEAAAADKLLQTGKARGKLFGVPISVKESFDVAEMVTTGGLRQRQQARATADAQAVARLRQAGAIILGKTNTPTLCFCQESENKLYGRTNNPWNPERTAGGSSGGEGALLAAGGAAVGFGSDIGGSIRFPAHFNGVVGFKSGQGQVPDEGHFPATYEPLQKRMLGMGALAKSVDDAALIHGIVADTPPPAVELQELQLTVLSDPGPVPLGTETRQIMERIAGVLGRAFPVEAGVPPFFHQVSLWWQLMMSYEGAGNMITSTFSAGQLHPWREYLRELFTGGSDYHRYFSWAVIGSRLFKPSAQRISKLREELRQADAVAGPYFHKRIVLLPTYHTTALPHGQVYRQIFSVRKTFLRYMPFVALANVLGLPALTLPVGIDRQGLPIGVQLVSAVGNEKALFQLGRLLEKEFGGYQRCQKYDE